MEAHVIRSKHELEEFLEKNIILDKLCPNNRYHLHFDLPESEHAMIVITRNHQEIIRVNALTWRESYSLRVAFSYGDNHRSAAITWHDVMEGFSKGKEASEHERSSASPSYHRTPRRAISG
jgi:hypothetical protein